MLYVEPDFYSSFKCAAGACRHSCCIGWEIDIDRDTADYYAALPGKLGAELREKISPEPEPHFILGEDERCPFLDASGLCRLISELGQEALCDICREHPRFYNYYPGRLEQGLGLCCQAAAELLLAGDKPLELLYSGAEAPATGLLKLRSDIFAILRKAGISLPERMIGALKLCGIEPRPLELGPWAGFLLSLERLDGDWTGRLELLAEKGDLVDITCAIDSLAYERVAEYFIYRHFAAQEDCESAADMLVFSFLSAAIVCALDALEGNRAEQLRMYSAEIEYSDVNIALIRERIRDRRIKG